MATEVTQKRTQSESIHSTILNIHVLKAEHQNSPFLSMQLKLDKAFIMPMFQYFYKHYVILYNESHVMFLN